MPNLPNPPQTPNSHQNRQHNQPKAKPKRSFITFKQRQRTIFIPILTIRSNTRRQNSHKRQPNTLPNLTNSIKNTARKRLLAISGVKPFVVQNLGKYERQLWQAEEFGPNAEQRLADYTRFIIQLYQAQPLTGPDMVLQQSVKPVCQQIDRNCPSGSLCHP